MPGMVSEPNSAGTSLIVEAQTQQMIHVPCVSDFACCKPQEKYPLKPSFATHHGKKLNPCDNNCPVNSYFSDTIIKNTEGTRT